MSIPTIPDAPPVQQFDLIPLRSMGDEAVFEAASNDFWPRVKPFAEDLTAAGDWIGTVYTAMGEAYQQIEQAAQTAIDKAGEAAGSAQAAGEHAQTAQDAIAVLEPGAIVNGAPAANTAWPSERIEQELQARGITRWEDLSGAAAPPLYSYYNGYWKLTAPVADVALEEPGVSEAWQSDDGGAAAAQEIGQIVYSFQPLDELPEGNYIRAGQTYLQSAYPDLFGVIGIGEAPPRIFLSGYSALSGQPQDVQAQPNGTLLAARVFSSPYLALYNQVNGVFYKLGSTGVTGITNRCKFSGTGGFFASLDISAGKINIYSAVDTPLSFVSEIVDLPSQPSYLAWSADDSYLVCCGASQTFVYKRTGNSFARVTTLTFPATGAVFCPLDDKLTLYSTVSPYLKNHRRSGDSFIALSNPSTMPTSAVFTAAYNNAGDVLLVGAVSPALTRYAVSGNTFTAGGSINVQPAYTVSDINFLSNDKYVYVSQSNSGGGSQQRLLMYSVDGTALNKTPDFNSLPSGNSFNAVTTTSDGLYLSLVGSNMTGGIAFFQGDFPFDINTEFYVPGVPDLSSSQIGDWVPSAQGKAFVRAK